MKFLFQFQRTALVSAIERNNYNIVQLLLSNEKTDPNVKLVYIFFYLIPFQNKFCSFNLTIIFIKYNIFFLI